MKATISLLLLAGLLALPQQPLPRPPRPVPLEVLRQSAQPIGAPPIDVLNVEKGWGGADALMPLTLSDDAAIRNAAVRALGRLESPALVLPLLSLKDISPAARADAVAQSLKGFDAATDPRLVQTALEWLYLTGDRPLDQRSIGEVAVVLMPLGRIAYATAEQMHKAEGLIVRITRFARPDVRLSPIYLAGLRALESLARVNTRVAALEEETAADLKKAVNKGASNDNEQARLSALGALISGRRIDDDIERVALKDDDWQVRRLAMTVLAGGGAGLDDDSRNQLIVASLEDREPHVRYEALRAYIRRAARTSGCGPILDLTSDPDQHVALAAIDALGDLCKEDEELTARLAADARTPPAVGSWHRDAHAFVALAKRSAEKAAPSMEAFVTHSVWWVRMYAVGAAAVAGDMIRLEKLAADSHDNVVEAAIESLRRLKKFEADPAIVAALSRSDVQLLRTAAMLLKESPRNHRTFLALRDALKRLTTEGKETSRDTRLALLDAMAVHADADDSTELLPLLKDFDPRVADRTALLVTALTGRATVASPAPYARGWPQAFNNLRQCVTVQLGSGSTFQMAMEPASAPITVDRFLKLATTDRYYDGLTIHRVVPNFVIQGGSPGANEYAGHKEYMRDEVGGRNGRGSVGLSTRGRNTADAQFFINLVDNARLNFDYTVFAQVVAQDMDVVDKIQEGDVLRSINISKCPAAAR